MEYLVKENRIQIKVLREKSQFKIPKIKLLSNDDNKLSTTLLYTMVKDFFRIGNKFSLNFKWKV